MVRFICRATLLKNEQIDALLNQLIANGSQCWVPYNDGRPRSWWYQSVKREEGYRKCGKEGDAEVCVFLAGPEDDISEAPEGYIVAKGSVEELTQRLRYIVSLHIVK